MKIAARLLYDDIRDADSTGGLYVWVDPDEASVLAIQKLMKGAPFKLHDTTRLHCTVLHHQGPLPHGVKPPTDRPMKGEGVELEVWEEADGEHICVLSVESQDLQNLHKELLGEGLKHSFDDFKVHMTVGKNLSNEASTRLWIEGRNEFLRTCPLPLVFDPKLKGSSLK